MSGQLKFVIFLVLTSESMSLVQWTDAEVVSFEALFQKCCG